LWRFKLTLEHGKYTIIVEENIINVTLEEAFNEQGAQALAKELTEIINTFNQQKILILGNLLKLLGATPEAFAVSNKFNEWLNTQNLVAKALVINSATIKAIDQQRVPSKEVQNIAYFDNEADALSWLKKYL